MLVTLTNLFAYVPYVEMPYNAVQSYLFKKAETHPCKFQVMERAKNLCFLVETVSLVWATYTLHKSAALSFYIGPVVDVLEIAGILPFNGVVIEVMLLGGISLTIAKYAIKAARYAASYFSQKAPQLPDGAIWHMPAKEKLHQFLYFSRCVIHTALVFLKVRFAPLIAACALFEAYTALKIEGRKWFRSKYFIIPINPELTAILRRITATYHSVLLNAPQSTGEPCTICLEKEPAPEVYFCANHRFHTACIVNMVNHKLTCFTERMHIDRRTVTETRHNHTAHYDITLPRETVPSCPNCRERPEYNDFKISIQDNWHGKSKTTIHWTNDRN